MSDIAREMEKILNSAEHRSLYSGYKVATAQELPKEFDMGKFPGVGLMDKYPAAFAVLDQIGLMEKYPEFFKALEEVGGDVNNADVNYDNNRLLKDLYPEVFDALEAIDYRSKFPDLFNELSKMHAPKDLEMLTDTDDDLVVVEDPNMGELPVEAAYDLALDSLLTASAALDQINMVKSAEFSLRMAQFVVEAKKAVKDKKKGKPGKKVEKKDSKKDSKDSKKDSKDSKHTGGKTSGKVSDKDKTSAKPKK